MKKRRVIAPLSPSVCRADSARTDLEMQLSMVRSLDNDHNDWDVHQEGSLSVKKEVRISGINVPLQQLPDAIPNRTPLGLCQRPPSAGGGTRPLSQTPVCRPANSKTLSDPNTSIVTLLRHDSTARPRISRKVSGSPTLEEPLLDKKASEEDEDLADPVLEEQTALDNLLEDLFIPTPPFFSRTNHVLRVCIFLLCLCFLVLLVYDDRKGDESGSIQWWWFTWGSLEAFVLLRAVHSFQKHRPILHLMSRIKMKKRNDHLAHRKLQYHAKLIHRISCRGAPPKPFKLVTPPRLPEWPVINWRSPEWPAVGDPVRIRDNMVVMNFGKAMRDHYFSFGEGKEGHSYLNAASYGGTPKPVREARYKWDLLYQHNPGVFRRTTLPAAMEYAVSRLSAVINSNPAQTVLMPNANAATATVLKGLPWRLNDTIFIFDVEYRATVNATEYLKRTYGVGTHKMHLKLPDSPKGIVDQVRKELEGIREEKKRMPLLANFCHVTSSSAYIFPAKELVDLFRSYGILVMIDGAQAAGHLDINVHEIDADWYLGTVHKWMYSCPGVGFLVTRKCRMQCTFPLQIGNYSGKDYKTEFSCLDEDLDFGIWLSLIDGLDFVEKICGGWDAVRAYCRSQAEKAVKILRKKWKTEPAQLTSAYYGNMPLVPLPKKGSDTAEDTDADAGKLMLYLASCNMTTLVVIPPLSTTQGRMCVRCTCQIYTCSEDWIKLADLIQKLGCDYSLPNITKELAKGKSGRKKWFRKDEENATVEELHNILALP